MQTMRHGKTKRSVVLFLAIALTRLQYWIERSGQGHCVFTEGDVTSVKVITRNRHLRDQ